MTTNCCNMQSVWLTITTSYKQQSLWGFKNLCSINSERNTVPIYERHKWNFQRQNLFVFYMIQHQGWCLQQTLRCQHWKSLVRESLGLPGIPWEFMGFFGIPWDSLGFLEIPWDSLGFLGFPGIPWDSLGILGIPWKSLGQQLWWSEQYSLIIITSIVVRYLYLWSQKGFEHVLQT